MLSFTALFVLSLAIPLTAQEALDKGHWPTFRGRFARGVSEGHKLPTTWDVEKGENIAWKIPIDGMAHSSPVIWGDRIYLTTATKDGEAELKVGLYGSVAPVEDDSVHELKLICIDRTDGKILWTKTAWKGVPAIKRHPKSSHAASSPATDGEHILAFFASEGLYCYDPKGEHLWKKCFGVLDSGWSRSRESQWGFASSPIIHEGKIIVQCDVQDDCFLACLDIETGKELWRAERDELPGWGTPTVDVSDEGTQIIVNGYKHIGGYDIDTGDEFWRMKGGGDIPVPTPIVSQGIALITSAHGRLSPMIAIAVDASGELTMKAEDNESVLWNVPRGGNYMQTPIAYGDEAYFCRDNGVLSCMDLRTGERKYRERLGTGYTGFSASGVAGDGKLYFTSEMGEVFVVAAGTEHKLLAMNELGEMCMASPAIATGTLYFRTRAHLIAISKSPKKAATEAAEKKDK